MLARQQLAALNHNNNVGRKQARKADGTERWKLVFPKAKKAWVARKIYSKKSISYMYRLMQDVMETKAAVLSVKTPECIANYPDVPTDIPANIATVPRPPKVDVIAQHMPRLQ
eukprot:scpid64077/ scgid28111/ 